MAKKKPSKRGRRPRTATTAEQSVMGPDEELLSLVAHYFCEKGIPPGLIAKHILKDHKRHISREAPYQLLSYAAQSGRLNYVATVDQRLSHHIKRLFRNRLKRVVIVNSADLDHVAYHGALVLLDLLSERGAALAARSASKPTADTDEISTLDVRVKCAFGGGQTLKRVCELLKQDIAIDYSHKLPRQMSFHSLIGVGSELKMSNPHAFFSHLSHFPSVDVTYYGFPAPDVVTNEDERKLKELRAVEHARELAENLDVICTSASRWRDKHSSLIGTINDHLREMGSATGDDLVAGATSVGDFLWFPLDRDGNPGPYPTNSKGDSYHVNTLIKDLDDLERRISRGTDCLLVAGPCPICHEPRSEILQAIFYRDPPPVTHLVIDKRSAMGIMQAAYRRAQGLKEVPELPSRWELMLDSIAPIT